ncbi:hypothetical protein BgiBS90_002854 [Biomphalaria glabrata]|uniref:C-type lectin domain-containing protein n=1 Tax=Biomphalaria glabrata TaxID=6526 RepID=A0A2C9KZV3_BIOGL|nr:hypothetical protein BgiBS90_002854 [Biomphalaria glabrata]
MYFSMTFQQVACLQSCKVPGETYTIFRTKNYCLTIGQTKHPCLEARKLCLNLGGELADFNESLTILKNWTNVEYWIANHSQVTDATRNSLQNKTNKPNDLSHRSSMNCTTNKREHCDVGLQFVAICKFDFKSDSDGTGSGVDGDCNYLCNTLNNTSKAPFQPIDRSQEFCTYVKIKPNKKSSGAELNCFDVDLTQCGMVHVKDSTTANTLMTDTTFHPQPTSLPQEMCDCRKDTLQSTDDKAFQVVPIVFGCLLSISFVMNIILYRYRKTYILKYQEETFQTSRNDNSSVNVVAVSPDDNYEVCTSDESSSGQTQRRVIDVVDCGNYSEVKDEELVCHDIANGHRVGVGSVNPADQATLYTILDHKGSHLVLKDPSHVYGLNSGSAPSLERPHDNYEVCASDESYSIKFQRRVSDVVDSGNYSEAKEVGLVERGISNGQEVCGGESSDNLSQTGTYTALNHKGSHLALNDPSHVYGLNSGGTQSSFDELSNNQ